MANESSPSRTTVLLKWGNLFSQERELEEKLRSLRKKRKILERENPFLGTIKGILKKDGEKGEKQERMEEEGPSAPKRKKAEKKEYTEESRTLFRSMSAAANKIKQLKKNGRRPDEETVRRLAAAAVGLGRTIEDSLLRGLTADGFGEAIAEEGYPVNIDSL